MADLKIYMASKMRHAPLLQRLYLAKPEVHFTNRWIWLEGNVPDSAKYAKHFWLDDLTDVAAADAVVLYGEPEDVLRGALVEAGGALMAGKRVVVVGENPGYGTWQHHPMVSQAPNIECAIRTLMPNPCIEKNMRREPPGWFFGCEDKDGR